MVVPHQIWEFPILLHAVLAFSALQLQQHEDGYGRLAHWHYSKCVTDMIPVLESEDFAADGRILAATVILRMYEMLQHCKFPINVLLVYVLTLSLSFGI